MTYDTDTWELCMERTSFKCPPRLLIHPLSQKKPKSINISETSGVINYPDDAF